MSNTEIEIACGALQFMHQILNRTPFRNKAHANRLRKAFSSIQKPLDAYNDILDEIRTTYWKEDVKKDAQGNDTKSMVIPMENRKKYEEAILNASNATTKITLDPPSLLEIKSAYNGLFEQKDIQENGMAGETQAKMIAEIGRALGEDLENEVEVENVDDGQQK